MMSWYSRVRWVGGEIGRRTALRTRRRKAWEFESPPTHKNNKQDTPCSATMYCKVVGGDSKARTGAPSAGGDVRAWSGGEIMRRHNFERLTESPPTHYLKGRFGTVMLLSRLGSGLRGSAPMVLTMSVMMPQTETIMNIPITPHNM